ncbi:hypothetical protein F5Y09DRAFT_3402 [Xylaria sp. FL1042]|nr:hypothetical protein F5Y09DRAFT_739 [Xylaria sp. FL1042]KAI0435405.1 hypothetical protein F5Y09DRAFT_3402 [Xylaria sp. FL1042]
MKSDRKWRGKRNAIQAPHIAYVEDADDDGYVLPGAAPYAGPQQRVSFWYKNPAYKTVPDMEEADDDGHVLSESRYARPQQSASQSSNPLQRAVKNPTDFKNLEYKTISRDNTADEDSRRSASLAYLGSKLTSSHDRGLKLKSMRATLPIHKDRIQTTTSIDAHTKIPLRDKPYLCTHKGCKRSIPGNGFPRRGNLQDHLRSVHGKHSRRHSKPKVPFKLRLSQLTESHERDAGGFSRPKEQDFMLFPDTDTSPNRDSYTQEFTPRSPTNTPFHPGEIMKYHETLYSSDSGGLGLIPGSLGGADLNSLPTPLSATLSVPSTPRSWTPKLRQEYRSALRRNRPSRLSSNRATVDRRKPS